jgi:hypothetical protein
MTMPGNILLASLTIGFLCCRDSGNKNVLSGNTLVNDSTVVHSSADTTKPVSSSPLIENFTDSALETRITDTLMKLSFIRKTNHYLDSLTNHKHGLSFIIDSVGVNELSVIAGYNGPERFETYYNFTVYPKTFKIMIEYSDTGELIPIEEYIKLKQE